MNVENIPYFNRDLFGSKETFTKIGNGSIGGKASGLAFIKKSLISKIDSEKYPNITIDIPVLTVLGTEVFDKFMQTNNFYDLINTDLSDERIAHFFQKGEFPYEYIGDLRGLIEKVKSPMAIRSSSLLEDAIDHPFAGVYCTKMISNNQPDADTRFRKLIEAVKFVYASTFFKEPRDYIKVTGNTINDEKMAVIIQEVVGVKYDDNFYPTISGVGRSFNFYPFGHAKPDDGVLVLALGLGKIIVDGGKTWSVSPAFPKQPPPYNSCKDIMRQTQSEFWAVNMGRPPAFDPLEESEYLIKNDLKQAEYDDTIKFIASTYQAANDRIVMGCGNPGPRVLDFAPLIKINDIPFINAVADILSICKSELDSDVEIEFAATIDDDKNLRIGFLQVRKMKISDESIQISESELSSPNLLLSSNRIMGNGQIENIRDIVYIKPENFLAQNTPKMALEIGEINSKLNSENINYLLIGFGRWGSSDPWLGVPVVWSQITNAKVIVEATLPNMDVDLSQGAHFFHNLTSFNIFSFSIHHSGTHKINFDWLNKQPAVSETEFLRHIRSSNPFIIKADTKNSLGVIYYD